MGRDRLAGAGLSPDVVAEVGRLVRMTENHPADDPDAKALSDADRRSSRPGRRRYAAYVADVRGEYSHVTDEDIRPRRPAPRPGRRQHLFHTAHGRATWEEPARANVARELAD